MLYIEVDGRLYDEARWESFFRMLLSMVSQVEAKNGKFAQQSINS